MSYSITKITIQVPIAVLIVFMLTANFAKSMQQVPHEEHQSFHTHTIINKLELSESFELKADGSQDYVELKLNLSNRILSFELMEQNDLYDGVISGSHSIAAYAGDLVGAENSWARFVIFNGKIMGAYYDGKNLFIVDKFSRVRNSIAPIAMNKLPASVTENKNSDTALVIFALKDVEHDGTCGSEAHSFGAETGYEALVSELQTSMAGTATKEINIALVADTEFVAENTNAEGVSEASAVMVNNLNIASGIFETQFEIQITATIVTELASNVLSDGTSLETSDPEVLVRALRDTNSIQNPGLRHLFTGKDLDGSTVGIAFVGSLCRSSSAGVTQSLNGVTAIILTHELGHNFGARHDSNTTACLAPDGGRYIMFPSVSSNIVAEFSPCSEPNIQSSINNSFNSCIVEISLNPPEIVSTPNTEAEVGVAYSYDSDNTVDVDNAGNATYLLEIAPAGMSISTSGEITWVPSGNDLGVIPVQIRVENADGQDTQFFEIDVASDFINIEVLGLDSYGRNQDVGGDATLDSPLEVTLSGNTWKSIPFDYEVTENTVIEFEFSSTAEAEIHGVGFDNNDEISENTFFGVYGTQSWGIQAFRYSDSGDTVLFKIPVGRFFTGSFDRLVLNTDNDANVANANSSFSNLKVYEDTPVIEEPTFVDLAGLVITPYRPGIQDVSGTSVIIENGLGIELSGNKWQQATLDLSSISPSTFVELEFRSTSQGEVHGISFLSGNSVKAGFTFQFYGTQNWGIQDFEYTQVGEYQKFTIPVGAYFTQNSQVEIIFVMDHDVSNPDANSSFRNIRIGNF